LIEEKTGGRFINKEELEEYNRWKEEKNSSKKPEFPSHPVLDLERRMDEAIKKGLRAALKQSADKVTPVRITRDKIDSITYLRNEYADASGQLLCHICKKEMPFKKRDETYYFEGHEIFDREHFPYENKAMYLALCPTCAAKYYEWVFKNTDKTNMKNVKQLLLDTKSNDRFEIPILIGEEEASICFVQTHFIDIQGGLQAGEIKKGNNKTNHVYKP
jgi:hypothetical protein